MKAALNLSCEFNEIPITIGDFLNILQSRKWKTIDNLLQAARNDCYFEKNMKALATIDDIRKLLTQIDESLMDYSSILNGYIKAEADLKAGIDQPPPLDVNDITNLAELKELEMDDEINETREQPEQPESD